MQGNLKLRNSLVKRDFEPRFVLALLKLDDALILQVLMIETQLLPDRF